MATTRIMVINWKWSDKLAYPTYIPQDLETNIGSISFQNKFEPLPVSSEEKIEKKNGTYVLKDNGCFKYIQPTKVDLSDVMNGSQVTNNLMELRQDYFEQVKKTCIDHLVQERGIDKNGIFEFVFLFHLGDGFDDLNSLLSFDETKDVHLGTFGKGTGIMYKEKNGLLPLGMATFRFTDGIQAGWFHDKPKYKAAIINESYFDSVWDHYWYMTQKRLSKFRQEILISQLSKTRDSLNDNIERLATSLISKIEDTDQTDQPSPSSNDEWDFSECDDLKHWVSPNNLKNGIYEDFVFSIKELAKNAGKIDNYDKLNAAFEKLMATFLS